MKFYQLPNSNLFTHRCYFSREKPLVKPTAPGSSFSYICLAIYFSFAFLFRPIKPKIQKYLAAIHSIRHLIYQYLQLYLPSLVVYGAVTRKGLTTPLTRELRVAVICVQGLFTFCCLVLLLVRYLGFITEGNTYRRCATSSLPLREIPT